MPETILTYHELDLLRKGLIDHMKAQMVCVGERTATPDHFEMQFLRERLEQWKAQLDRLDVIQIEMKKVWEAERMDA